MDLDKKQRYDEMIEEWEYVYDRLPAGNTYAIPAAIMVATEHHNSDLGQLAGYIRDNTIAIKQHG